jgi:molybdopterin/thiamine biosynthesis adenylyltransferase/molybdopterin synthase catalytic subunit/rhodanese-related sulfurtransferase
MFSITDSDINVEMLRNALRSSKAGAFTSFEGWVRDHNEGSSVANLQYECYETLAVKEGIRVIAEAKDKFDIVDATCSHRVGLLSIGDLAVWVGVTAAHRGAAFDACRYIIDQIKLRLPIWKKEQYTDGTSTWVNCSAHEQGRHQKDKSTHHAHHQAEKAMLEKSEYYSRQTRLTEVGNKGQAKLERSRVLVVGAGGTGCAVLNYLVAAGVGEVAICDFDTVAANNLHRQPIYTVEDIGQQKSIAARERLTRLNPFVQLKAVCEKFDNNSSHDLVKNYDLILDCTDNLTAKFAVADACMRMAKPLIQASIHSFDGQLLMWRPNDDRPQAGGRKEKAGNGQCYRCLWPSEDALQKDGRDCIESCAVSGVIGVAPGVLGTLQATEAIKFILDLPTPLTDHVLLFDLLTCTTKLVKTRQTATCKACGSEANVSNRASETGGSGQKSRTRDDSDRADLSNEEDEYEFELHWSVLRSRSPRELVYVDIRSESERKADIVTASKLSGRSSQVWNLDELDLSQLKLDRNSTYLIMCQRGQRSAKLVRQLRNVGHKNVFSLSQGVASMVAPGSSSMELSSGEKSRV